MFYAIHIKAPNDRNGNPRRAFLVYDEAGNHIGTVDEGYRGRGALADLSAYSKSLGADPTIRVLAAVDTTPAFYRQCIRGERVA